MIIHRVYGDRVRVAKSFSKPSRTKQSFKEETEINNIMAKYRRSGLLSHVARYEGSYGDFVGYNDYHVMVDKIMEANNMFDSLPSDIRGRFRNDPSEFLEFAQNPKNADELVKMGLAKKVLTAAASTPTAPSDHVDSAVVSGEA